MNYLKTRFIFDFIPLLPINFIPMFRKREYLFYVVKMTRLYRSLEFFDVHECMLVVKKIYKAKMQRIIDKDPKRANNIYLDNNKIGEILNISYTLRITQLVFIIGNISMMMALIWIIGCEMIEDFGLDIPVWSDDSDYKHPETFIHHF